jgi:hypothetical protein
MDPMEQHWARFKEAVVVAVKPMLKVAFDSRKIDRDVYKAIVKRVADKVIGGYKKEGLPPPKEGVPPAQFAKLEKLVKEYLKMHRAHGTAH